MKQVISAIAIVLVILAYIPYFKDIFSRKTKPHPYTWFIWGLSAAIIFAIQLSNGGGVGSFITAFLALICIAVVVLGIKYGEKDVTVLDTVFLILALLALAIWLLADQPLISLILLVTIDVFAIAPTIRKTYNKPEEETIIMWSINAVRYGLNILALAKYDLLNLLYPVSWGIGNLAFVIYLLVRRRAVKHQSNS